MLRCSRKISRNIIKGFCIVIFVGFLYSISFRTERKTSVKDEKFKPLLRDVEVIEKNKINDLLLMENDGGKQLEHNRVVGRNIDRIFDEKKSNSFKESESKVLVKSKNSDSGENFKLSLRESDRNKYEKLNDFTFEERDMLDEYGNEFTIIIWNHLSGIPGYLANPNECMGNISCKIRYPSGASSSAHAFVFKADHIYSNNLPQIRLPHQLYAWWTLESPLNTPDPPAAMDGIFNLTFHYRTDADVYAPYGSINLILRDLKAAGETNLEELLARKRNNNKIAVWAVSNCYNKRINYAKSLMKAGLQVDTFGSCFGRREIGHGKYSLSFYQEISKYKFYFSFENSITCKDYFTEKFWFNGLRSGAVPIVWGPRKEDILKVAPTKSFIHADDYSSPEEMVKYLKYLAGNETAYAEYLQWRTWINHPERIEERLQMKNRENDLRSFCKLCSIVQSDAKRRRLGLPRRERVYSSIADAWRGPEKSCHN